MMLACTRPSAGRSSAIQRHLATHSRRSRSRSRARVHVCRSAMSQPARSLRWRFRRRPNPNAWTVFAREADAPSYCEFNFSPSGEWAAYAFDGYRSGMRALEIASPEILVARGAAELVAKVTIGVTSTSATESVRARTHAVLGPNSRREAGSAGMTPLHLALSAVIEEANGRKSYWALAHPSGRPDFHHADCFALEIPAASES